MNDSTLDAGPPATLLLASDLSARCDRALDRAARLAGEWRSRLVVLTVADAPRAPDLALAWAAGDDPSLLERAARAQLQQDTADLGVQPELVVERGEPAEAIAATAARLDAGLVIVAAARDEAFGRMFAGSTVARLAATLRVPMLIVRSRARAAYRHVVVATDFSASSARALHAVLRTFPSARVALFHARSPAGCEPGGDEARRLAEAVRRDEGAAFLEAQVPSPEARARIEVFVEFARLEAAIAAHVRAHAVDLVAMGTLGRTGAWRVLLGSTAARLLDWVPCDTLVVPAPPGDAAS